MRSGNVKLGLWALAVGVALGWGVGVVALDWVLLGECIVTDRVEHDTIEVGADERQFSALKVRVLRRPVPFLDMKVLFANSTEQDVALPTLTPARGGTRMIDLVGDERTAQRVVLVRGRVDWPRPPHRHPALRPAVRSPYASLAAFRLGGGALGRTAEAP